MYKCFSAKAQLAPTAVVSGHQQLINHHISSAAQHRALHGLCPMQVPLRFCMSSDVSFSPPLMHCEPAQHGNVCAISVTGHCAEKLLSIAHVPTHSRRSPQTLTRRHNVSQTLPSIYDIVSLLKLSCINVCNEDAWVVEAQVPSRSSNRRAECFIANGTSNAQEQQQVPLHLLATDHRRLR